MTIQEAKSLIIDAELPGAGAPHWADLGCGSGTFSYALAELLPAGSSILCVDLSEQKIKPEHKGVHLEFKKANIEQVLIKPGSLDGILMANALHYVKDQPSFVKKLRSYLRTPGTILLVEYDMDTPNQWVPYPLSFASMQQLFKGYGEVRKLNERPSIYGRANLYGCQVLY